MSPLDIRTATPAEPRVLQRMLELYQHDLSDLWDQDLDDRGEYGYALDRYWSDAGCHPFVALADGRHAGFALVDRSVRIGTDGHWMDQFFVLKKYRRRGVGRQLATSVFEALPGRWEVGQMPGNDAARAFWRAVIADCTGGRFDEHEIHTQGWRGTVQVFDNGPATPEADPRGRGAQPLHGTSPSRGPVEAIASADAIRTTIDRAFAGVEHPGDWCLHGSSEGDEPFRVEEAFRGKHDWRVLEAAFLDEAPGGLGSALSFLSDEAFRFYLPAYLIADLDGRLGRADPVFHLTRGLDTLSSSSPINPRRYGARTWSDRARYRLAVFDGPQAHAIALYLAHQRDMEGRCTPRERRGIDEALRDYWLLRAGRPPMAAPSISGQHRAEGFER